MVQTMREVEPTQVQEQAPEADVEALELERRLAADDGHRNPDVHACIAAQVRSYRHPSEQVSSFFSGRHQNALRRMGDNRDIPVGLAAEHITIS